MKKILLVIFINLSFICATSSAVTYSFLGGSAFDSMDEEEEASGTVDGTTLTLKATSPLNFLDVANQFQYVGNVHGFLAIYRNALTFTLQFNKAVEIRQFTFERAVGPDISDTNNVGFKLSIGGTEQSNITLSSFTATAPFGPEISTATLGTPLLVQANTVVTFEGVVPTPLNVVGVSLQNMEVDVVPEPASYALGLGLSVLLVIAVRGRRTSKLNTRY